ncbi:MAG: hypothetical protein WBA46_10675, partial [Thermomicrobiales bacterium]
IPDSVVKLFESDRYIGIIRTKGKLAIHRLLDMGFEGNPIAEPVGNRLLRLACCVKHECSFSRTRNQAIFNSIRQPGTGLIPTNAITMPPSTGTVPRRAVKAPIMHDSRHRLFGVD